MGSRSYAVAVFLSKLRCIAAHFLDFLGTPSNPYDMVAVMFAGAFLYRPGESMAHKMIFGET